MNVIHCINSLDSKIGGPARSVPELNAALNGIGVSSNIYLPSKFKGQLDSNGQSNNLLAYIVSLKNFSPIDTIVHVHGIWNISVNISIFLAKLFGFKVVVSTRGMLEPWAFSHKKKKKMVAWRIYQQILLRVSTGIHATSEKEMENLKENYNLKNVFYIPNGFDHKLQAAALTSSTRNLLQKHKVSSNRKFIFLGRIHPNKGIFELLDSWGNITTTGWQLIIVGPIDKDYKNKFDTTLVNLKKRNCECVYIGELSNREKWIVLNECDVFVLPSKSESFGLAILEALASSLPVITSTDTPWRRIANGNAGWIIESNQVAISSVLEKVMKTPKNELMNMGKKSSQIAGDFLWEEIAYSFETQYNLMLKSTCI